MPELATKSSTENELQKSLFFLFGRLFPVIVTPGKLFREQVQPLPSHSADTAHPALHDAPEALDAVRVHVATDLFAHVVIDAPVDVSHS